MPGKGHLTLTGKLGDVMQESAQAADELLLARRPRSSGFPKSSIARPTCTSTCPEGPSPRMAFGPGITLATALVSALARVPVRKRCGDDR